MVLIIGLKPDVIKLAEPTALSHPELVSGSLRIDYKLLFLRDAEISSA